MTPPPADKQVAHHDALFVDLEKDTRSIKGEYYGAKISIIVPVYGPRKYLERCVKSVLKTDTY